MKSNDEHNQLQFERIEKYFLGKMDIQELREFESDLRENEALRIDLEEQRTLIRAIEAGAFKESLEEIHSKTLSSASRSKNNWWAIAAGLAVIMALGWWAIMHESREEQLFAEYIFVEPGLPVSMSASDDYILYDAMVDYKAEKYDLAVGKWKDVIKNGKNTDTLNYFIGSALFNQKKYSEAIPYFETVNTMPSVFAQKAQMSLVLSLLQTGESKKILEITPIDNSQFEKDILEIQKELKS